MLGRHVTAEFRERGHDVRVLTRRSEEYRVDLRTSEGLDAALAGPARAFREGDRAFDRIDDLGGIDGCGWPRELVAAMRAPHRAHEARVLQLLEELADGGESDARALGDLGGARECR